MMSDLALACSHCTLEFAVSEWRCYHFSSALWCPFCGSRELRVIDVPDDAATLPLEAA
jgi:Zn finger protein HypA/HybF involved in hydrogenase expression